MLNGPPNWTHHLIGFYSSTYFEAELSVAQLNFPSAVYLFIFQIKLFIETVAKQSGYRQLEVQFGNDLYKDILGETPALA